MFEELDAEDGGEEQEMPMNEFGGGGEDIDDILGDAPDLPDDEYSNSVPQGAADGSIENDERRMRNDGAGSTNEDDEEPIEPTYLGDAIDSLMMHWCQLLTNVSVKAPVPPPSTLNHVKEVAEVCSKHFRDASVDVNNEFTRLGVQWEMEQPYSQYAIEEENLDEAIERQETIIAAAREMLNSRIQIYNEAHPNAGKHFTT
ncbi:Coiled-coil domain-containing protein mdt-28 [Caenorhabditis elegans]|uniref:Isoform a of Coiled-coil domain-containing protein mdt-28 n=1 Tax=Caenorhabditis elegans TaxID=6239 RepID=H9G301-2|nr:Coiled-coil domain-containing protein mdt-28 [Caenorhabditis elegans]CAB03011.1 Coiled-coil domain-containing protein mdt-28 [Caenorhabditis elegans]|eukprot:NP_001256673.1 Coiled-coil domain-containing protein mdt-28 [Caenorhabditis elegans]